MALSLSPDILLAVSPAEYIKNQ